MNRKIFVSLTLATLLVTGCGSANTDKPPVIKEEISTPKRINVEASTKEQLQKYLRENGDTYQSASYSNDKKEILLVGIQDTTVTFYKFDAETLALKEKFSFDNIDGQIGIKDVGSDGLYTIIAYKDSDASDYLFDSVEGKLEKKKEYQLKDPKEIIQQALGDTFQVLSFHYTPQKGGALVRVKNATQMKVYLYGMEDPSNPQQEYAIFEGDERDDITDITFLGDGLIRYKHVRSGTTQRVRDVWYNYFPKGRGIVKESMDREFEYKIAYMPRETTSEREMVIHSSKEVVVTHDKTKSLYVDGEILHLMDITDPSHPSELGSMRLTRRIKSLSLSLDDSKLYLADYDEGFKVIDIADASNPKMMFYIPNANFDYVYHVEVSPDGERLYVTSDVVREKMMKIYDISNVTSDTRPKFLGMVAVYNGHDMAISDDGSITYVADFYEGLRVFDTSDATNPKEIAHIDSIYNENLQSVEMSPDGERLYVGYSGGILQVMDISNPAKPSLISSLDLERSLGKIIFSEDGKRAYVNVYGIGVTVLDTSDIDHPKSLKSLHFRDITSFDISKDEKHILTSEYMR